MQSGGGAAEDGRAPGEADRRLLHRGLARLLDEDDEPGCAGRRAPGRLDSDRNRCSSTAWCPTRKPNPSGIRDLSSYVRKIARLGGWLARAGDPLPGDTVLWRGMVRLADIVLGSTLALGDVGN